MNEIGEGAEGGNAGSPHGNGGAGDGESAVPADRRLRSMRVMTVWSVVVLQVTIVLLGIPDSVLHVAGAPWRTSVAFVLLLPMAVSTYPLCMARLERGETPSPWWYWGSLGCLVVMTAITVSPSLPMYMTALWGATCAFLVPIRQAVPTVLLAAALPWAGLLTVPDPPHLVPFSVAWVGALLFGGVVIAGWLMELWLWQTVHEVVYGEDARSRLAVTDERLRFARDMHDLLGHSLSALATKSELASRLAERAPERAAVEIAEVRALARESLAQVRSAVRGYREVDLAEETENVRGVLAAGGIRVLVDGLDRVTPSREAAELAAWVVREGGTNVLRHSDATECRITFTWARDTMVGPGTLVVEVANDRACPGTGTGAPPGSGLAGLRERVFLVGGSLSASPTRDGGFLLRAVVPG
ncbi:histidine kinase [Nocardiopsis kunsanensis]|uniref:Histidine kinase n=1 Tax=Nocardiopsis kunsanensis TaxID=141693 RepID=A0A918XJN8_9ACTN|nr:histidine kinase [Nocardiopsis kunsanensis]GHD35208.1 histidine kinase [Nocardiopsis kunsanensis]